MENNHGYKRQKEKKASASPALILRQMDTTPCLMAFYSVEQKDEAGFLRSSRKEAVDR